MGRRVGIVGYGKIGQFLVEKIQSSTELELAFVWNRTSTAIPDTINKDKVLENLDEFASFKADLIIEVAHPDITKNYGEQFLATADYMVGSPTVFADALEEEKLVKAATTGKFGMYIPSGALFGAQDIQKMAQLGTLKALKVTMKKHPQSFRLNGDLATKLESHMTTEGETLLYSGPVRQLCPMAPNNVNTMACASMAARNLGFDKVEGCLISDPGLEAHIVMIEAVGPGDPPFTLTVTRYNPAKKNAVTGNLTYDSFWSSTLRAKNLGSGVHFV